MLINSNLCSPSGPALGLHVSGVRAVTQICEVFQIEKLSANDHVHVSINSETAGSEVHLFFDDIVIADQNTYVVLICWLMFLPI